MGEGFVNGEGDLKKYCRVQSYYFAAVIYSAMVTGPLVLQPEDKV